jgi:carboxypeptidase PM20D1
MKLGKRIGIVFLLALALVGAFSLYRFLTFAPSNIATGEGIAITATPPFELAAAADNLGAAIRFRTVSNQNAADNDFTQWTALHDWLKTTYPAAHGAMQREMVAEHSLIYTWPGSDPAAKPVIVMAHQDVVPVTPGTEKEWAHPPFGGVVADKMIWGRGAIDDKGSLIALFEAIDALARSGFAPKRTVYLVSGHDEEVGGSGAIAAAEWLKAKGVQALFAIDEGGVIITDPPIVDDPAALIGIAEKGYATLKLTAKAPGGHSSMPPAETGVVTLSKAILAISGDPFPMEINGPAALMLETLAAKKGGMTKFAVANRWLLGSTITGQFAATPSGAAMLHTTIAPTMLEGSPKENVLPQTASALINYRLAPWNRSTDVMARAKAATEGMAVDLSWVKPPREPSKVSSTISEGWRHIVAAAQAGSPGLTVAPYLVVGGTDGRAMQDVADDVYRFAPARFSTKDTTLIHGTNEHISFDNLQRMIDFYARLIMSSAG